MCDCNDAGLQPGQIDLSASESITIDLLQMYRIPVACLKQYSLHATVGSTEQEVNEALGKADNWITIKMNNVNALVNFDEFEFIKMVAFKAIDNNVCK